MRGRAALEEWGLGTQMLNRRGSNLVIMYPVAKQVWSCHFGDLFLLGGHMECLLIHFCPPGSHILRDMINEPQPTKTSLPIYHLLAC